MWCYISGEAAGELWNWLITLGNERVKPGSLFHWGRDFIGRCDKSGLVSLVIDGWRADVRACKAGCDFIRHSGWSRVGCLGWCLYLFGSTHTEECSLVGWYYYRPMARRVRQNVLVPLVRWISLRSSDTSPPSNRSQRRQATQSQRWNMKSNRLVIAAVCLAFLVFILLFEDSEQSRDVWTHDGARNHKAKHSGQPGMKRHGRNRRRQHRRKITGRQSGHHRAVITSKDGEWNGRCRLLNCFAETRQTSVGFHWEFDRAAQTIPRFPHSSRFIAFRSFVVCSCVFYLFYFFITHAFTEKTEKLVSHLTCWPRRAQ